MLSGNKTLFGIHVFIHEDIGALHRTNTGFDTTNLHSLTGVSFSDLCSGEKILIILVVNDRHMESPGTCQRHDYIPLCLELVGDSLEEIRKRETGASREAVEQGA